ncbi:MAG: hypothetical protein JW741_11705 [Sedimentisphaerales bacterium]|nr:hypothetical protein [Sedimentisphaerales bacterium]
MLNEVKHPGLESLVGIAAMRVFRAMPGSFITLRFVQDDTVQKGEIRKGDMMMAKSKAAIVAILLLGGAFIWAAGAGTPRSRRAAAPDQQADPYEGTTVLVEAFVVEVDLAALYEMDVNPLGREPHCASVEDILGCLRSPAKARVLLGAKAVGIHETGKNQTRQTETVYRTRTRTIGTPGGPQRSVDYTAYEYGQTLAITPEIRSDRVVALGYDFDYSGVRMDKQDVERPPDSVSWSWNGTVSLESGQPRIAGAMQDEEDATFFILTAHILD